MPAVGTAAPHMGREMFRRVPTYEISNEAETALQLVATQTGVGAGRALNEAISLLKLVHELRQSGKRVYVVNEAGVPENEIPLEIG